MRRWSRDHKSKPEVRVTLSNKGMKHMCVDLSDYKLLEPNLV